MAADSGTPAGSPNPTAAAKDPAAARAKRLQGARQRGFFFLHGDGVAMKPDRTTVAVRSQKGIIQAVDANSMTLKSPDGYTQTYVLNADTKVREKGQPSKIEDLKAGEMAKVIAIKEGDKYVAKLINCVGEPGPRLKALTTQATG
jgi:hypothetical protein